MFSTGDSKTDYLLTNQHSWTGTSGQSATIHYSWSLPAMAWIEDSSVREQAKGKLVDGKDAVLSSVSLDASVDVLGLVLEQFSNVANINFTVTADPTITAQIAYRAAELNSPSKAITATPNDGNSIIEWAGVILDPDHVNGPTIDAEEFYIILHETGHALGLSHPDARGVYTNQNAMGKLDGTIMVQSGDDSGDYARDEEITGLQFYDIIALQYLYGANYNYNAGDTTYSFDGVDDMATTIWDGGGIDTFDTTSYSGVENVIVDLREGVEHVSLIGKGLDAVGAEVPQNTIWIAKGANIENAITGSGNDTISGNGLGNLLITGGGVDVVVGNGGDDTLIGSAGADELQGGDGDDVLIGYTVDPVTLAESDDGAADFLQGNAGNDLILGGDGNDTLAGGANDDNLQGGAGNDTLIGGTGDDVLDGGSGTNALEGGIGNDTYILPLSGSGFSTVNDDGRGDANSFEMDALSDIGGVFVGSGGVYDLGLATLTLSGSTLNISGAVQASILNFQNGDSLPRSGAAAWGNQKNAANDNTTVFFNLLAA